MWGSVIRQGNKLRVIPESPHAAGFLMTYPGVGPDLTIPATPAGLHMVKSLRLVISSDLEAQLSTPVPLGTGVPKVAGLRGYQVKGYQYVKAHGSSIIGDQVGAGKSAQAIALLADSIQDRPGLVVCPASLKTQWAREVRKWLGDGPSIQIIPDGKPIALTGDIVIVNYDILAKHEFAIKRHKWSMMVADEAHYLKGWSTLRSKSMHRISYAMPLKVGLTATPLVNRPRDLIQPLKILHRLDDLGGWEWYVTEFCRAYKTGNGWRFDDDFVPPHILKGLNHLLSQTCYIRRLKSDVAQELPPVTETVVALDVDLKEYRRTQEQWIYDAIMGKRESVQLGEASIVMIGKLRQAVARAKVKPALEFLDNLDGKTIVFAMHKEIQEALLAALPNACHILSSDSKDERQRQADKFNDDPNVKYLIGGMGTSVTNSPAGVGWNLQAAENVVFVEIGWNPALHDQCIGRASRLTTTHPVNAWFLVVPRTIEVSIWNLNQRKKMTGDAVQDGLTPKMAMELLGDEGAEILDTPQTWSAPYHVGAWTQAA
ncbi:helicase-like protein [Virus Rctr71]|nr:helicase-like protein [Virus Rctr71]